MAYSDWQIVVIKAALRAHKAFYTTADGQSLTWQGLACEIAGETGQSINPEILRQFVQGVSKKTNPGRQRVPEGNNLEAIVRYLMHPDIDALAAHELNEPDFAYHAPVRLLAYLKQDFDQTILSPPLSLQGSFQATLYNGTIELDLQVSAESDVIQVTEREKTSPSYEDWSGGKRQPLPPYKKTSRGWAILTPEDNLFAFMKEMPYGKNHYYFTVSGNFDIWAETPLSHLIFLRLDYPEDLPIGPSVSPEKEQSILKQLSDRLGNKTLIFHRVT